MLFFRRISDSVEDSVPDRRGRGSILFQANTGSASAVDLNEGRRRPRGCGRMPTALERAVVAMQLGRPPLVDVAVPGLCSAGNPVISTYPVM